MDESLNPPRRDERERRRALLLRLHAAAQASIDDPDRVPWLQALASLTADERAILSELIEEGVLDAI